MPSQHVANKLARRGITLEDLMECFGTISGKVLIDTRERSKTTPPTLWFISTTKNGRALKVVFIYFADVKEAHIKSAYEPSNVELALYKKLK